ncbi:DinB family protein [uncultured Croceitalea sp.]|uniref:DinB family protein n=1 Tax=uncultured Croceitalea sp. TaxID=1798908 RepID=UPI0033058B70
MIAASLPEDECHSYYRPYVNLLGDNELLPALNNGAVQMNDFMSTLQLDRLRYTYGDGKWTVAEVLMHIIDAERIFQYRALRFARNDASPLMGFEQDDFIVESGAERKTIADILKEYQTVRSATLALFESFTQAQLQRLGEANSATVSVRALGFIIAGHQLHHMNVLLERYL